MRALNDAALPFSRRSREVDAGPASEPSEIRTRDNWWTTSHVPPTPWARVDAGECGRRRLPASWGPRARTWNSGARTRRVADYTNPHWWDAAVAALADPRSRAYAVGGTRTHTARRPRAPEARASTNSATTAGWRGRNLTGVSQEWTLGVLLTPLARAIGTSGTIFPVCVPALNHPQATCSRAQSRRREAVRILLDWGGRNRTLSWRAKTSRALPLHHSPFAVKMTLERGARGAKSAPGVPGAPAVPSGPPAVKLPAGARSRPDGGLSFSLKRRSGGTRIRTGIHGFGDRARSH